MMKFISLISRWGDEEVHFFSESERNSETGVRTQLLPSDSPAR